MNENQSNVAKSGLADGIRASDDDELTPEQRSVFMAHFKALDWQRIFEQAEEAATDWPNEIDC